MSTVKKAKDNLKSEYVSHLNAMNYLERRVRKSYVKNLKRSISASRVTSSNVNKFKVLVSRNNKLYDKLYLQESIDIEKVVNGLDKFKHRP